MSPDSENSAAGRFEPLIARAAGQPVRTAVVHPVDARSLGGALAAAAAKLITPVLVGPDAKIKAAAEAIDADLSGLELIDTPHSHAAAEVAAGLAARGDVLSLMKGALHTNELMGAVVPRSAGLRTERRMSHVFVMSTPAYPKWLLITDGGINIEPDLAAKRCIVQNAIDVARAIGVETPKVAILSATEEVDPSIRSTVDAAALCKMSDRGQIIGGLLDGPLAFDLAISQEAVLAKGIQSRVAGEADILVVPNLEAGNMVAKQLDYLAGASAAGVVVGARVPIVLTSRSDEIGERVASCAVAACLTMCGEQS